MTDNAVSQLRGARLLVVAAETPAHVHVNHLIGLNRVADIAVTLLTVEATSGNVHLMVKEDKAWHTIDSHPGDGFLTFPVPG
jgi:hypothetical protein